MTRTKKYAARMSVSPDVMRENVRSAQRRIICDMNHEALQRLLDDVKRGTLDTHAASDRILEALRAAPFEDLGFARVDTHREVRQGFPEVILGMGKTPAQIAAIAGRIVAHGQTLLVTRASREAFDAVHTVAPSCEYHEEARVITLKQAAAPKGLGTV